MGSSRTKRPKSANSEVELHNTLAFHGLHGVTKASEVYKRLYSSSRVLIQR